MALVVAQRRAELQEYVEQVRAAAGDSLRPGPWELEAADRPGALPNEYEMIRDYGHMFKVHACPRRAPTAGHTGHHVNVFGAC